MWRQRGLWWEALAKISAHQTRAREVTGAPECLQAPCGDVLGASSVHTLGRRL